MSGLFGKPNVPALQPLPVAPSAADPAVEEARRRELVAQRKAKGRSATLLTGGAGDDSAAPVRLKRLLGE